MSAGEPAHAGERARAGERPARTPAARILAVDVGTGTADVLLTVPGAAARERRQARGAVAHAGGGGADPRSDPAPPDGALQRPRDGRRARRVGDEGAPRRRPRLRGHRRGRRSPSPTTWTRCAPAACAWWATAALDELRRRLPEGSAAEIALRRPGPAGAVRRAQLLGVEPAFDAAAVAVQDHGFSPGGSNRVFRFGFWRAAVRGGPPADRALLRRRRGAGGVHAHAGRRRAGPASWPAPGRRSWPTPARRRCTGPCPPASSDAVLVNAGNGHTICVVTRAGRLAGVFEHHTRALDGPRLQDYLRRFLAGTLADDEVREQGGHGAVLAAGRHDGPAGDRHGPAPRAPRGQRPAARVRRAARRHDAHRLLRPAARASPTAASGDQAPGEERGMSDATHAGTGRRGPRRRGRHRADRRALGRVLPGARAGRRRDRPGARRGAALREVVARCWPALERLGLSPGASANGWRSRRPSTRPCAMPTSCRRARPTTRSSRWTCWRRSTPPPRRTR